MRSRARESTTAPLWQRHFSAAALCVVAVAAFNLTWRVTSEFVSEWDESLYGITAWEMVRSGNWIATTFLGSLDYYNSKPPLNVWLMACAFKLFGTNLVSMRMVSILSSCSIVAVLVMWGRQLCGATVGLLAGIVLATSFAFVYVHAGRSGNTDALFTLLVLLTVVTLNGAERHPRRIVWLGPILAATFLLKGMAVLLPLTIVALVEAWRFSHRRTRQWSAVGVSVMLFVVPVGGWVLARWQLDQTRFLSRLLLYDFVAGSLTPLEGHHGGPLYYVNVLQKYHYDWLTVAVVAAFVARIRWSSLRPHLFFWRAQNETTMLLGSWVTVTLLIPTLMQTKNAWYLQPFYPAFALVVAWLVDAGLRRTAHLPRARTQRVALIAVVLLALGVAEARLWWYSFHRRDAANSAQGLILASKNELAGGQVFRDGWNYAEIFTVRAIAGARERTVTDFDAFLRESGHGDYFLSADVIDDPRVAHVGSSGGYHLYRRCSDDALRSNAGFNRSVLGASRPPPR